MKSFIYTLVAVAALSLGGVFASTAIAGGPHGHHNHGHHGHNHGHNHYHGHHNHGHNHFHSGWGNPHHHHGHYHNQSYYRPYGYAQPSGLYLQGRNFGFRIGF